MPIHITHSIGACTKQYCAAWLRLCVSILFLTMMQSAWAMTPADQNYDGLPVADQGSNSVTINGITYTNNAAINITIVNDGDLALGADHALAYRTQGPNASTLVSFKTSDGDEFKLNSFAVSTGLGTTTVLTIKGYKDNVEQVPVLGLRPRTGLRANYRARRAQLGRYHTELVLVLRKGHLPVIFVTLQNYGTNDASIAVLHL